MSNSNPVDGKCNAQTRDGGYCANPPKGDAERCRMHGADSPGGSGSPPKGSANALTHGVTASPVNLFDHLDSHEEQWVREIARGYLDIAPFDADDPRAERLLIVAVKIYQEWSGEEQILRDGMSEDVTVGVTESGNPVVRTQEHHLRKFVTARNREIRMNLKDLGLLDDSDSGGIGDGETVAEIFAAAGDGS